MKKKFKRIKLKFEDEIKYVWKTEKYGRASFRICPIWKRGKLQKVLVYPEQQKDKEGIYYEIETNKTKRLSIGSWQHKGILHPEIWDIVYCDEHKTVEYDVYVPPETNVMTFRQFSFILDIKFEKREKNEQ